MRIKLDTADKVSEAFSALLLLTSVLIISFTVSGLPDTIPVHFDSNGTPNRYGSKHYLWVVVGMSAFLYIGLTILARFPQKYNFHYTKNNIHEQYRLTSKMVRNIKWGLMLFQTALAFFIVQSVQLKLIQYVFWLLPLILLVVFGNIIYYTIKFGKLQ